MIVQVSSTKILRRLGNNLRPFHGLPIPERSTVLQIVVCLADFKKLGNPRKQTHDRDLNTLCITGVSRVLEARRHVEVFCRSTSTVNIYAFQASSSSTFSTWSTTYTIAMAKQRIRSGQYPRSLIIPVSGLTTTLQTNISC